MSDLLFEYKVRARHRLGWKEFTFYATTDIEEFLNRNSIDYVRNATDTVENRLFKENKRLNNIIKEVREYITYWHYRNDFRINSFTTGVKEELLEILDRVD